jgi:hypothetical protein
MTMTRRRKWWRIGDKSSVCEIQLGFNRTTVALCTKLGDDEINISILFINETDEQQQCATDL